MLSATGIHETAVRKSAGAARRGPRREAAPRTKLRRLRVLGALSGRNGRPRRASGRGGDRPLSQRRRTTTAATVNTTRTTAKIAAACSR